MFKKEYFFVFALIGLSIAYVILAFLVFITRGKWGRVFCRKLAIGATIVALCAILNTGTAYAQTAEPTPSPTPVYGTPEPTPVLPAPMYAIPEIDVFFTPQDQEVKPYTDFTTELHVGTMGFNLASFDFDVTWSDNVISVDTNRGNGGVGDSADNFLVTVTASEAGRLSLSGVHATGAANWNDVHLTTIYWTAGSDAGSTILDLTINSLAGPSGEDIGRPTDIDGSVVITGLTYGDVNDNGEVDIIDALLIAQYYVGLNPSNFNVDAADVNGTGQIDIVDALLISQKYVGLIDTFIVEE